MERGSGLEEEAPSAPAWKWFLLGFVVPGCVLFWDVLANDRNFAYRDAAHFYYPYYKLIAAEWGAGRVPLWNPYENGGEPLAAQPTAAVWYPGKLLFALPYPLAFKSYHLLHVVLAWWAAFWCGRTFGLSRGAAAIAGTGYAFSGFVLFQLYNIVFLVGAAWLPLGLACMDRVVRAPSRGSAFGLAAVLAMQILGGDPEVAILTLLVGLPYLLLVHFGRQGFWWGVGLLCLGHAAVFFGRCLPPFEFAADHYVDPTMKTLALGWLAAAFKYPGALALELVAAVKEPSEWPFLVGGRIQAVRVSLGWTGVAALIVGVILLARRGGFRTLWNSPSLRTWFAAGIVAGLLAAVQILPTRDLVDVSDRSAPKAPHESVAFSLFPARVLETALPAAFGRQFPTNARWAPFSDIENGLWTASLYMGLPVVVLGLAALRWRRDDPRLVWTTWTLLLTLWLAFGKFGGVYWPFDPYRGMLGRPLDAPRDAKMYGVSDGLYRLCEETIPLFASFRYPEKCFLFCAIALALLAGWGVDRRVMSASRFRRALLVGLGVLAAAAVAVWLGRGPFERGLGTLGIKSGGWGPFDAAGAWSQLVQSLLHAAFAAGALLALGVRSQPRVGLLLILVAADLATAQRWLILSESQASIDKEPKLRAVIEEAEASERGEPSKGEPFRIHRTRIYSPVAFHEKADPRRSETMNEWERETLQPKYGLPWRLPYATTTGTMAVYDVEFFFAPWGFDVPAPLRRPGVPAKMTYYPRVGYNLWGAKYFILPDGQPIDHDERGVFTMTHTADGDPLPQLARSPFREDDYVLLRNTEAFPRAWIVHSAEVQPPIYGLRREDRTRTMERLLYRRFDRGVNVWEKGEEYPLRRQAIIETADPLPVLQAASGGPTGPGERVTFVRDDPGRVEMEATLERPGFVVISNAYYRGWKATVDGAAAPILRANRAMQAVPVPSGRHTLVLTYSCRSTMIGGTISAAAWAALLAWLLRRR
jgi:hypothetical protein